MPNPFTGEKKEDAMSLARIGGAAYLLIVILGLADEMFIRNDLIVSGNPAATAKQVAAHMFSWRLSIAGDIMMHVLDGVVSIVYFTLLRRVNKPAALLALFFGLIQTAVLVINKMNLITPLLLLGNNNYANALGAGQVDAMIYLSVVSHGYGFGLGLIFFGFECLIDGWLIARSGFLPRILGRLIQFAGMCYLVNSFALLLNPPLADILFPFILLPPFVGELSMACWLLFKGIDKIRWEAQTA